MNYDVLTPDRFQEVVGELKKENDTLKQQREDLDRAYRSLVANVTALLIEKREYLELTGIALPLKSEPRIEKALKSFREREVLTLPFS